MERGLFMTVLIFCLLACTTAQNSDSQPPKWFTKLPKSKNKVYVVGYAQSTDQSIAYEKAHTIALAELAKIVNLQKDTLTQRSEEYETVNKAKTERTVFEVTLSDISVVEKVSRQTDSGLYETYILLSYDKKKIKQEK